MFRVLSEAEERLGIEDYSVSQTSLEQVYSCYDICSLMQRQVFLHFAKDQHTEEDSQSAGQSVTQAPVTVSEAIV